MITTQVSGQNCRMLDWSIRGWANVSPWRRHWYARRKLGDIELSPQEIIYVRSNQTLWSIRDVRKPAHRAKRKLSLWLIAGLLLAVSIAIFVSSWLVSQTVLQTPVTATAPKVRSSKQLNCAKFFSWDTASQEDYLVAQLGADYQSKASWLTLGGMRIATVSFTCQALPVDVRITQISNANAWQIKNIAQQH